MKLIRAEIEQCKTPYLRNKKSHERTAKETIDWIDEQFARLAGVFTWLLANLNLGLKNFYLNGI